MGNPFDVVVIGAGIVGMATAMKMAVRHPGLRMAVVDKESRVAGHQTGHNSGVIHSGIYYRPGSLKARLCVSGAWELARFCDERGVPYELCGKVVVATRPEEMPMLHELHRRGQANGVPGLRLLDPSQVREYEPYAASIEGMLVPGTGIIDFRRVTEEYAKVFEESGGELFLGHRVRAIRSGGRLSVVETGSAELEARLIINCAGLYSDHVARMAGLRPPCRIVPFRGEYYSIKHERKHLVRNLIYPVPDPRFPFLGVHFTRMLDGKVEAGPNAVLAWAREGYEKTRIEVAELAETLTYKGFWRLAVRYWKPGLHEMVRSWSKALFTIALQRLVPDIRSDDLLPGGAGVRAQALKTDGSLLDDFVILPKERTLHVLNAPSPAATSSLAIAEHIVNTASSLLG